MIPLLAEITVVVTGLIVIGLITIVGLDRVWAFRTEALSRFRYILPYLLVVGAVLFINSFLRDVGLDLSWIIGWNITDSIVSLEGSFVGWVQTFSHPVADVYFSYTYIYGYIFLLLFPVIAYFVLADSRPVRETALAYAINYGVGVTCYILFIAYGPRNVIPDLVDQTLYLYWPESDLLTTEVNTNTNVFPSLHTSLAVTVALLAVRTREEYPLWVPVSTLIAVSVTISTMYLGIHWLTDVVAGIILALIGVGGAAWLTSPEREGTQLYRIGTRLRELVDHPVERAIERVREWRYGSADPS